MSGIVGLALESRDRRNGVAFGVHWSELVDIDVRANDRPGERIIASRIALVGPFAWAAKNSAGKRVLAIKATWGEALLLVHGQTPLELEAALSPLRA
jgi:hypothetical protein